MKNILKNSLIFIFLFCSKITNAQKTQILDSIRFSNNIGRNFILYVKEDNVNVNRIVEIYSIIKDKKKLIAQNKNIILCKECGGMRGDTYISIDTNKNFGFSIYLDNNEIIFKPLQNNFILLSSKFTQILNMGEKNRKGKIKTKTLVYTPKKTIYFNVYSSEILEKKCFKTELIN